MFSFPFWIDHSWTSTIFLQRIFGSLANFVPNAVIRRSKCSRLSLLRRRWCNLFSQSYHHSTTKRWYPFKCKKHQKASCHHFCGHPYHFFRLQGLHATGFTRGERSDASDTSNRSLNQTHSGNFLDGRSTRVTADQRLSSKRLRSSVDLPNSQITIGQHWRRLLRTPSARIHRCEVRGFSWNFL